MTEPLQQGERRFVLRRLTSWARVNTIGDIFELVFKAGVIVVALTYIFRPAVQTELPPKTAVFIDYPILETGYGGAAQVPPLVRAVADAYNGQNTSDISQGLNKSVSQLPLADLCRVQSISETIKKSYGEQACAESQTKLGRGRYYERYMLVVNECARTKSQKITIGSESVDCPQGLNPLDPEQLKTARRHLQASEYRRADLRIENSSSVPAQGLGVRQADDFVLNEVASNQPGDRSPDELEEHINNSNDFQLRPNETLVLSFRTATGNPDPGTEGTFGLNWQRPERSDIVDVLLRSSRTLQVIIWLVVLFFVVILASVLITEYGPSGGQAPAKPEAPGKPEASSQA